jgi:arylformamidase
MPRIVDISMTVYDGLRTNSSRPGEEAQFSYDMTPEADPHGKNRTIRRINARLHTGTHIDAPEHMEKGGKRVDQYPLESFMGTAWIVDMRDKVPGGEIAAADLDRAVGQKIKPGENLIVRTDWTSHYTEPDFFENSPYLTHDAALWCIDRKLNMVAVDFLTDKADHSGPGFKVPLLGAGILNMTNVDNLGDVTKEKVTLIAFPLKIIPSEAGLTRAIVIEED